MSNAKRRHRRHRRSRKVKRFLAALKRTLEDILDDPLDSEPVNDTPFWLTIRAMAD